MFLAIKKQRDRSSSIKSIISKIDSVLSAEEFNAQVEKLNSNDKSSGSDLKVPNIAKKITVKYDFQSNKISEEKSEFEESPALRRKDFANTIIPVKMFTRSSSIISPNKTDAKGFGSVFLRSPTRVNRVSPFTPNKKPPKPEYVRNKESENPVSLNESKRQRILSREFIKRQETNTRHPLK